MIVGLVLLATPLSAQTLQVASQSALCGQQVSVPVTVSAASSFSSFGFRITYNTSCLDFVGVQPGTATSSWSGIDASENTPGTIIIGGFRGSASALNGSGEIVRLLFNCAPSSCDCNSTLTASQLVDDLVGFSIVNGSGGCASSLPESIMPIGSWDFQSGLEGWTTGTGPTFTPATTTHVPGYVVRYAPGNNSNTFGFMTSPAQGLTLLPYDPMTDPSQTGTIQQRQGPLYLIRYHLRRTTANRLLAPTLRARVNSSDFQDYREYWLNSADPTVSQIPDLLAFEPVDLLFQPNPLIYTLPQGQRWYTVSLDLLNFDTADDANGGYILDRVELFLVPTSEVQTVATLKTYDFSNATQTNEWQTLTTPPFTAGSTAVGSGNLEAWILTPGNALVTWQNLPNTINLNLASANLSGAYFLRSRARLTSAEPSGLKVPELRYRLAPVTFDSIAVYGMNDANVGSFMPTTAGERYSTVYLKVPARALGSTLSVHQALDLLAFENHPDPGQALLLQTSAQKVFLDDIAIDLLRIPDYPAPVY